MGCGLVLATQCGDDEAVDDRDNEVPVDGALSVAI
jgi:hypothetical protein